MYPTILSHLSNYWWAFLLLFLPLLRLRILPSPTWAVQGMDEENLGVIDFALHVRLTSTSHSTAVKVDDAHVKKHEHDRYIEFSHDFGINRHSAISGATVKRILLRRIHEDLNKVDSSLPAHLPLPTDRGENVGVEEYWSLFVPQLTSHTDYFNLAESEDRAFAASELIFIPSDVRTTVSGIIVVEKKLSLCEYIVEDNEGQYVCVWVDISPFGDAMKELEDRVMKESGLRRKQIDCCYVFAGADSEGGEDVAMQCGIVDPGSLVKLKKGSNAIRALEIETVVYYHRRNSLQPRRDVAIGSITRLPASLANLPTAARAQQQQQTNSQDRRQDALMQDKESIGLVADPPDHSIAPALVDFVLRVRVDNTSYTLASQAQREVRFKWSHDFASSIQQSGPVVRMEYLKSIFLGEIHRSLPSGLPLPTPSANGETLGLDSYWYLFVVALRSEPPHFNVSERANANETAEATFSPLDVESINGIVVVEKRLILCEYGGKASCVYDRISPFGDGEAELLDSITLIHSVYREQIDCCYISTAVERVAENNNDVEVEPLQNKGAPPSLLKLDKEVNRIEKLRIWTRVYYKLTTGLPTSRRRGGQSSARPTLPTIDTSSTTNRTREISQGQSSVSPSIPTTSASSSASKTQRSPRGRRMGKPKSITPELEQAILHYKLLHPDARQRQIAQAIQARYGVGSASTVCIVLKTHSAWLSEQMKLLVHSQGVDASYIHPSFTLL